MLNELIEKAKSKNAGIDEKKITLAFNRCKEMHEGQKRVTGENYFEHPLGVAIIVTDLSPDTDVICAALLHDTIEDTDETVENIKEAFGNRVALLVEGMSEDKSIEDWHKRRNMYHDKIMKFGERDKALFFLKLSDVMHNVKTIHNRGEFREKRYKGEVNEFYVPLARMVGNEDIAKELEKWSVM